MKSTLVIACLLYHVITIGAQQTIQLHLKISDTSEIHGVMHKDTVFQDKTAAISFVNHLVDSFQKQGYLACYSSITLENDRLIQVHIHKGLLYSWTHITYPEFVLNSLSKNDLTKLKSTSGTWTYLECQGLMNRLADSYILQGYPYVQVYMDSTRVQGFSIHSKLNVIPGPLVILDTLEWDQDVKVKFSLLSKIIGFQSGSPYSKKAIEKINQNLSPYPFLQQYADPDIFLSQNQARVRLYLRTQKSSAIDALLGVLPSSDGPLQINGTFRSDFLNQLGLGERLVVDFRSLQSNSQDLTIRSSVPYLFNLPFNPFFQFNLYRRDSLFLDVFGELGASISLGGRSELRFVVGQKTSSLLQPDLVQIRSTRTLPAALDLKLRHLGAFYRFNRVDVERNPKSGLIGNFAVTGSTREILPNASITNLKDLQDTAYSFASLYGSLKKTGYAFEFTGELEKYTRLGPYSTWQSKLKAGFKTASTALQLNEQYRLGGFNLLRGFDEESIFAGDYYLWTNALRLITGELSYLQVYTDLALVNQFTDKRFEYRTFWGIGSGLVFDTSLGLLSLSAAAGKIFPDPFNLRNIKLHLGYINYF